MAVSARSLEQPKPTILIGRLATLMPLIPADGLLGLVTLPSA
jgi:hypothetical protein